MKHTVDNAVLNVESIHQECVTVVTAGGAAFVTRGRAHGGHRYAIPRTPDRIIAPSDQTHIVSDSTVWTQCCTASQPLSACGIVEPCTALGAHPVGQTSQPGLGQSVAYVPRSQVTWAQVTTGCWWITGSMLHEGIRIGMFLYQSARKSDDTVVSQSRYTRSGPHIRSSWSSTFRNSQLVF